MKNILFTIAIITCVSFGSTSNILLAHSSVLEKINKEDDKKKKKKSCDASSKEKCSKEKKSCCSQKNSEAVK